MKTKPPKRGRPKSGRPAMETTTTIKASRAQLDAWRAAAEADGRTLADWMRRKLDAAVMP